MSLRFSRPEYWSGLSCPSPGDLPDPKMDLKSLMPPAVAGGFLRKSQKVSVVFVSSRCMK